MASGWLSVPFFGALLQNKVPQAPLLAIIGIFLIVLPLLTMSEKWTGYRIPEANDRVGGFGSGFMGGLSGHQGALRAMFLTVGWIRWPILRLQVSLLCALTSRIPVYLFFRFDEISSHLNLTLVLVASALIGVNVGKRWLKSLKSEWIHNGVMIGIVASGIFYIAEAIG